MSTYSPWASGLGNSAAYQVSGKPYLTGSVIEAEGSAGFGARNEYQVQFPTVTKYVKVINYCTSSELAVYFVPKATTPAVATGIHYYVIPPALATNSPATGSFEAHIKCKELYITAAPLGGLITGPAAGPVNAGSFGVYAELTGIDKADMYALTGSGISVSTWSDGQH
jgi:hypothetical protein